MDDELYDINLAKGESILMYDAGRDPEFVIRPVEDQSGKRNAYGLNKAFLENREYMYEFLYE